MIDLNDVNIEKIIKNSYSISECAKKIYGSNDCCFCNRITRFCKKNNISYSDLLKKREEKHYYCLYCGKEIIGKERSRKKFCNHSCSASYNNTGKKQSLESRLKRSRTLQRRNPSFDGVYKEMDEYQCNNYKNFVGEKEYFCLNCGKKIEKTYGSKANKFCNSKCQGEYTRKESIKRWKNGELSINPDKLPYYIKKYMFEKNSYKCEKCGFEGYNKLTHNTILQIHHKDGDASNNKEENLQVLCPNCHAMTETFGNCGKRKSSRGRYDSKKYYFKKFKEEYGIEG